MKHGKKPTVQQRKLLQAYHMAPGDWLVVKDLPDRMEVVHRYFDLHKTVPKGGGACG